jgi:hypothetical protein
MEQTTRSALIYYTEVIANNTREVYVMLAKGLSGITTPGGRSLKETEIDRLVREINEELRGIIDFNDSKELLYECQLNGTNGNNKSIRYDGCFYCFIKVDMGYMRYVKEQFPKTTSERTVCNELISIEILNIKDIIVDMVCDKYLPLPEEFAKVQRCKYTETFERMFMSVGFDLLFGNKHNKPADSIGVPARILEPLDSVPLYVSIRPYRVLMPKVYGIILKGTMVGESIVLTNDLYIGDQFYFEGDRTMVYRSGVFAKDSLLRLGSCRSQPE